MGLFSKRRNIELELHAYKLLNEAHSLADVMNTTIDEERFYSSYERLIEIFTELVTYERQVPFTVSPKEDLRDFKRQKQAAIKAFNERRNNSARLSNTRANDINSAKTTDKVAPSNIAREFSHYTIEPTSSETITNPFSGKDPYFEEAARLIIDKDKASIGMLQRYFKIGFNRAARIMDQLEEARIVGPEEGTIPRRVLVDAYMLEYILAKKDDTSTCSSQKTTADNPNERIELYNNNFDCMTGTDFEMFCADILRKNGFNSAEVTKGSGDHGVDILAEKDDVTYAIQCKCYSSNIGNAAVQQALTGKKLYHRDIAVVLTNQYFTHQAKEEASALGVKLWDRDKLNDMIEKSKN